MYQQFALHLSNTDIIHETLSILCKKTLYYTSIQHHNNCLRPQLGHLPLARRLIISVSMTERVVGAQIELLDLLRLDDHDPEVLPAVLIVKVLNLHARLVVLVIVRLILWSAGWGCPE